MAITTISNLEKKDLENQGYRVVGNHSVVKVCHWTKKSLKSEDVCYKCQFYGIKSWGCVEMSPTWLCDHRCVFCWRNTKYSWPKWIGPVDNPKDIVEGCIKAWQGLLNGFKGNERTDQERFKQTRDPLHFAISLTGEPTMYPKLPEMIDVLKEKKISSFLVTNGTIPEMIDKLTKHQPTQIYVSVYGPAKAIYEKTAMPLPKQAWDNLQATLNKLGEFNRSVVRLTLTKGYNMVEPELWGKFLSKLDMTFVELKGYMWIGHSRERLTIDAMPTHEEIQNFAQKIAQTGGFKIIDNKANSRVVLLMREGTKAERFLEYDAEGKVTMPAIM
ncbi:4-demethylwyosine synthase TYW1 [Candidatus Woesearchaeota archaeon]|nr:4-demethylwyosine synthase TYW1 [Candidatus Woesearchaeota archaeon]